MPLGWYGNWLRLNINQFVRQVMLGRRQVRLNAEGLVPRTEGGQV